MSDEVKFSGTVVIGRKVKSFSYLNDLTEIVKELSEENRIENNG
jgi:hypothetical protein